jgi:FtsH-binding integral membrane protein
MERPIIYTSTAAARDGVSDVGSFFRSVYGWMTVGLGLTAIVALYTVTTPTLMQMIFGNKLVFYGLVIGQVGLVIALSAAINRLSATAATLMFCIYAALSGLTFASIFVVYTQSSIASTFFVTAGTFGAMSLYGLLTKKDLSSWGSFLFMGLIGVVIASIVNIFLESSAMSWVISCAGVLVFTGLTAYDTHSLKVLAQNGFAHGEERKKLAIIGALKLYLDFINLFLMLLRLLGGSRD